MTRKGRRVRKVASSSKVSSLCAVVANITHNKAVLP
jgi:hypothetical protein